MYSKGLIIFVSAVLVFSCGNCESLSKKQEQDIVKYVEYEINNFDVHDEETLGACLLKIADLLKPYMRYGIRTWDVPVMEPLFLKHVHINQQAGGTKMRATFKDVLVYGLSEFKITYLKAHPADYSYNFTLHFPQLMMLGMYDIDGRLLVIDVKDHGPFTGNMSGVEATVHNSFKVQNGQLHLYKVKTDFNFKKFRFHLDNLLQGSPIGETVNESLNQNVDEFLKDLKPAFVEQINRIVIKTLQKGLQNIPLAKWEAAIKS